MVEVDYLMVVDFVKIRIYDTHSLSFLIHLCHDFLSKDWNVQITHVYRELVNCDPLCHLHTFDSVLSDLVLSDLVAVLYDLTIVETRDHESVCKNISFL